MGPDLGELFTTIGFGAFAFKQLRAVLRWDKQTYPPCESHIQKIGRGLPWADRILVHTTTDGRIEMVPMGAQEKPVTKRAFLSLLRKASRPQEDQPAEESSET